MEHISVIEEIKRLKREGLSLEDIRNEMSARLNKKTPEETGQSEIDLLANRVAEVVRSVMYSFFEGEKRKI